MSAQPAQAAKDVQQFSTSIAENSVKAQPRQGSMLAGIDHELHSTPKWAWPEECVGNCCAMPMPLYLQG